jgi:hypothetical protein
MGKLKNKRFFWRMVGMAGAALVFGLIVAACDSEIGSGYGDSITDTLIGITFTNNSARYRISVTTEKHGSFTLAKNGGKRVVYDTSAAGAAFTYTVLDGGTEWNIDYDYGTGWITFEDDY